MSSPILPLRAAIRARCLSDAGLAALMGGAVTLWDEPPAGAEPVYAVFGDCVARDWSGIGDRGHEQDLSIAIWGKPGSAASALGAAERMAALIDDAPLTLAGHRLVGIAVSAIEVERDRETGLARVTLRLRATTEVLP